jgi:hypothetical protein
MEQSAALFLLEVRIMFHTARPLLPHETLLLACATPFQTEETRYAVAVAASHPDLDWPAAARMSLRHGIAPCVAVHLRDLTAEKRVPDAVATCFARLHSANAARNRVMFREASRLQRALAARGIACLILKGAALSLTAYPTHALRNFADIDLLVAPEDYLAACAVAEACGFVCDFPEPDPYCIHQPYVLSCAEDILTETLPLEFDPEISRLVVAANCHRILVEIHRGLFHDANGMARETPTDGLWEGVQTAAFPDGTPFAYPAIEVMLFHLAAHAADHEFGRLMFFMDIAVTAQQGGDTVNWDRVIQLAVDHRVEGHVYHSLELAHRAFDAPVPTETLAALARRQRRRASRLALSLPKVLVAPLHDRRTGFLRRLLLASDARQMGASLLSTVAPPPLMMRRIYGVQHPLVIAALYPLRPLLLLIRLAGHLLRQLRHPARYGARGPGGRFSVKNRSSR